jgi:hypothetical protein
MAIIMCANCDDMFDGDYNAPTEWKGECICESCAEYLVCGTCEASVNEGGLNGDGECLVCAGRSYEQEQRDTARTLGEGE